MLPRKSTAGRALPGLVLLVLCFLSACGVQGVPTTGSDWTSSTIDRPTGLVPDTATRPSTTSQAAETAAVPPIPPPPQGEIPPPLVGEWSGGEGSKSGYRLTFLADGTYELIHERGTAIPVFREAGYCAGDNSSLLLRPVVVEGPVERRERTVRWGIQPSSVVDVLTVIDPIDGEFSYVRVG